MSLSDRKLDSADKSSYTRSNRMGIMAVDERHIGEKGRVTIPKELRERLGFEPGERVSIGVLNEEIVVKPSIHARGRSHPSKVV